MVGRLVAWESFALYRTTTPRMQCRQSDALEARSVTHQIKGEDGAMTGSSRSDLLYFICLPVFYFLLSDVKRVDCVLVIF